MHHEARLASGAGEAPAPTTHPDHHVHGESPVDLPPSAVPLPHGLRWTSMVLGSAVVTLALLNAHAIRGWAYQLPNNALSARAVAAAEGWYALTGRLGLNRPVETMHGWWQAAEAAQFEGKAKRDEGD